MRKLLLLLLFAPFASSGQQVTLKADTASFWVDKIQLPRNSCRVEWRDSSMGIIGRENNIVYVGARVYYRYTDAETGLPFASFEDLKAWVRQYFFVDAPSGGGGGGLDSVPNPLILRSSTNPDNVTLLEQSGAVYTQYSYLDGVSAGYAYLFENSDPTIRFKVGNEFPFKLHPPDASGAIASFSGSVSGIEALQDDQYATLGQAKLAANYFSGWAAYQDDQFTESEPFNVPANTKLTLPNNAGVTIDPQRPLDVEIFYNAEDSTILGREGDGLSIAVEFWCMPGLNATYMETSIDIGGAVGELHNRIFTFPKGAEVPHSISFSVSGYTLDTWAANGGKVKVYSDGELQIYGIRYILTRTHKAR